MRIRTYRAFCRHVQAVGGIVTVLVVLSPKWGARPDDFYLGYPARFYVTQYDVSAANVAVLPLLFDLLTVGLPVFAMAYITQFAVGWLMVRRR